MELNNAVAVVTGANRGLGRRIAEQLLERGAKVYAGARRPETVDLPGAVPLRLDITDPESVRAAAAAAPDATLLVNNAGISTHTPLMSGGIDRIRLEMDTHFYGTLQVTRAFAPVIEGNGGGSILNVLSVLSWVHPAGYGAYSAGKAAAWSLTNSVREELEPRGIQVSALHVGYMDTDMADYVDPSRKTDPAAVAAQVLEALEKGTPEVLADELTRQVKQGLGVVTG
ncbi:short-chain dehydrogenase [Streptomyces camponoticapitis]|uniref:Short-chain dehydrogenase n=1 Tax=Streptomyces camponoticapitis TaxID=1616125 RepID=A0ABQ2E313_9ACTN|nr:SDR family oxidoreductase [Streptomyces camponoticapitis]GGJ90752.1 short-chain dehydrogenase [Streptomyces camponoticapitis]